MSKKRKIISLIIFISVAVLLIIAIILTKSPSDKESINEAMKEQVLHESDKFNLFGLKVNAGVVSAFSVTAIITVFAVIVRVFVIPKFSYNPNKFQIFLEESVSLFSKTAEKDSKDKSSFIGAYIFTAGVYVFFGTLFELFGFQAISSSGKSVTLPAPLSDINGAISLGCLSYLIILFGGIRYNGIKGVGKTLKEFSLPLSMSFRLFGALLSGALVTELVYYYTALSFVLPVIVGLMFTVLHAIIQAYVLTMLTSLFYGEVTEKKLKEKRK